MTQLSFDGNRIQDLGEETVIVIDPGHGGENYGTIQNGHLEKEMTLTTATAMYEELSKYDNVTVYMTRTDDVDMTLLERAEFAAEKEADFLFSIHYNASVHHNLYGSEVWIPAFAPFHSYGYQFGAVQMETMADMGLSLRGVKSKIGDNGQDYYGIIRQSTALDIPACIIEHCHVDEARDSVYCETKDQLIAFGRADATSVAKYLGLKSTELGVDYSGYAQNNLANITADTIVSYAHNSYTAPEYCSIELVDADYDNGDITITVSGGDSDAPLLYYDYSLDAGLNWSELGTWPGSDVLNSTYDESFTITLTVPSGQKPNLMVRAYNIFDARTPSNTLIFDTFHYGEEEITLEEYARSLGIDHSTGIEAYESPLSKALFPLYNCLEKNSTMLFTTLSITVLLILFSVFTLIMNIFTLKRRR